MMNTIEIKMANEKNTKRDIIREEIENLKNCAIRGKINKNIRYAVR